jgi:hypothetical protein
VTRRISLQQLVRALGGDEGLVSQLVELGVVQRRTDGYTPQEVERVLVSYTLVRELGVNWEGVEVVLRLREELLGTRRQIARLLEALKDPETAKAGRVDPNGARQDPHAVNRE